MAAWKNRDVLLGEIHGIWEIDRTFGDQLQAPDELMETIELIVGVEVPSGFLEGVARGEEFDVLELPEPAKTGAFTVGGREEDVGVKEGPVQGTALALRPFMWNGIGVEPKLFDFFAYPLIVLSVDGVLEEERSSSLLRVDLDGERDGGPEQKAFRGFLDEDFPSLLKSVAFAERCRDHNRSSFSHSGDLRHLSRPLLF